MSNRKFKRREALKASGLGLAALPLSGVAGGYNTKEIVTTHDNMEGKVAFVTGGARGIGLAIAEGLAQKGVHVMLFDIARDIQEVPYPLASEKDLANAKERIEKLGVKCLTTQGDVRQAQDVEGAIKRTVDELGQLDFVIANAGVTRAGFLEDHSAADMQVLLDVNLIGMANTIKSATPILKSQKSGRIVTLSSVIGRSATSNFPIYAATKWGVIGLTKSVAIELGPYNITCNAICPGGIRTPLSMNSHMLGLFGEGTEAEQRNRFDDFMEGVTPLPGGFLEPEEIAKTAVFLCSSAANNISGTDITVDAGWNSGNNT